MRQEVKLGTLGDIFIGLTYKPENVVDTGGTVVLRSSNIQEGKINLEDIISRIIEAGTVGMVAKTAINQLKLIPGLANIAADVINAVVAGAIVFSIGEASTVIMEKAYIGDIDSENLDWVNNVVESQMGEMIKKIGRIIAAQNGKIDPKAILKALFAK